MSARPEFHSLLSSFQSLYPSYSGAHGTFQITETTAGTGKKKGVAKTVRGAAPISAWEGHLEGGPKGLGLIPLLDDNKSAQWGAIDIDDNRIDLAQLELRVRELELPLLVSRSKSGGAHCSLFLEKPCPA